MTNEDLERVVREALRPPLTGGMDGCAPDRDQCMAIARAVALAVLREDLAIPLDASCEACCERIGLIESQIAALEEGK